MRTDTLIRCLKTYERIHLSRIKLFQQKKIRLAIWTTCQIVKSLEIQTKIIVL